MNVLRPLSLLSFSLLLAVATACEPSGLPSASSSPAQTQAATTAAPDWTTPPTSAPTFAPSPILTDAPTSTATLKATATATATASPSSTFTSSPTATVTPVPTYVKLRGKVIIDQAVCHYGPGAPYLYKYGVYKGSNLEILRRVEFGNYIEIQAIGGNNPCWVKVDYMDIKGDLQTLQPVSAADVHLPMSPYYAPLTGVSARRDGNVVTVFWHPLPLRPGDDSEQVPYIVEAWVCQDGQYVFLPSGSYQAAVEIRDEPGCSLPSHAYVTAAEKHGYTRRVEVPWPTADGPQLTPSLTQSP
jgi:hypothetical protein